MTNSFFIKISMISGETIPKIFTRNSQSVKINQFAKLKMKRPLNNLMLTNHVKPH